jgi:predicted alpha/beta superfamily hydrolase
MKAFLLLLNVASAAVIDITVMFSESSLDPSFFVDGEDRVFGLNFYSSCQDIINTTSCPGGQASFQPQYWISTSDKTAPNTWKKVVNTGNSYTGPIRFGLFAPQLFTIEANGAFVFHSSVIECADDLADVEMTLEICGQHGTPWTVDITDTSETVPITVFPAFGIGEEGVTFVALEQFYSPQLNNSRNISVYVPPSILQNKVSRPVNIMFLLDGSDATVRSYSTRTGFEAGQIMGVVPESIMIGISTISFAYEGKFDQRTYEMTYAQALSYPSESCISGRTGGAPLMLQWLDENVIDAVLARIGEPGVGMQRGEVSITGGSLGGLTSCYAAAARPDVFKRAVCSSPSNCFNYATGGLSPTITTQNNTGDKPYAVIQFLGSAETVDPTFRQLDYLMREDAAWLSIGMEHLPIARTSHWHGSDAAGTTHAFASLSSPVPAHVIVSYMYPTGQHAPSTWEQEFAAALPNLYRASRPANFANRVPKSEILQYLSAPSLSSSSDEEDDKFESSGLFTGLVVALAVTALALCMALVSIVLLKREGLVKGLRESDVKF